MLWCERSPRHKTLHSSISPDEAFTHQPLLQWLKPRVRLLKEQCQITCLIVFLGQIRGKFQSEQMDGRWSTHSKPAPRVHDRQLEAEISFCSSGIKSRGWLQQVKCWKCSTMRTPEKMTQNKTKQKKKQKNKPKNLVKTLPPKNILCSRWCLGTLSSVSEVMYNLQCVSKEVHHAPMYKGLLKRWVTYLEFWMFQGRNAHCQKPYFFCSLFCA